MTYDEKCYELALAFLGDHPTINTDPIADELAMEIQECIECLLLSKRLGHYVGRCRRPHFAPLVEWATGRKIPDMDRHRARL